MGNLQNALDALQPYVIGIRYVEAIPVVDAVFKEGWTLPDSDVISRAKGDKEINYFMIYSEKEGIGLDDLLEYVKVTIHANIEREHKHELLKERMNELKIIFKKNSLAKLRTLKFGFSEEDFMPDIDELDEINDIPVLLEKVDLPVASTVEVPEVQAQIVENREGLTEEEIEILEEEKRAANFFQLQKERTKTQKVKTIQKVELPPKNGKQQLVMAGGADCDCGPDEACSKCIDTK